MNTDPEKLFLFESANEFDESKVVSIAELSKLKLEIPEYQRPYTWSADSVNVLFNDIKEALDTKKEEYRLGSVILCKEKDKDTYKYLIVDGQQRLTTLAIMLYCLGDEKQFGMLGTEFNKLSGSSIRSNYAVLIERTRSLKLTEKDQFKNYVLNNCSVVKIVTDNEQAAFQFFDSQNSRGKALAPHDLLKAYHLREANERSNSKEFREELKKLVGQWERQNKHFEHLFETYLYPIVRWSKGQYGLNYSAKNISTFKGIANDKIDNKRYNYAIYHKASNLFVEEYNRQNFGIPRDKSDEDDKLSKGSLARLTTAADSLYYWEKRKNRIGYKKRLREFQLTQPMVAGVSFFEFTMYYQNLMNYVQAKIGEFHEDKEELGLPGHTGDKYARQLYGCVLLALVDRFGEKGLTAETKNLAYRWCYKLRLARYSLCLSTINNYALGYKIDRIEKEIPLFKLISEMESVDDLFKVINTGTVPLATKENIHPGNVGRYDKIFERLSKNK